MRYAVKQKLWQIEGRYTIQDEAGATFATVHPTIFSPRTTVTFRDPDGVELATVVQHLTSPSTYEIERRGSRLALVVGGCDAAKLAGVRFDTGKPTFTFVVDVPGPDDLTATGNVNEHEYTFERGARTVATVSKRWFTWDDNYGVEVADGEDTVLVLAATVIIDMAIGSR